jgi:CubicO group peptidase (beta-lactamase class C family)
MLTYLAANLGYEKTPLAAAMAAQLGIRRAAGGANMEIAYNWFIQTRNGRSIVWHNGGTGGYRSFAGFDPEARTGVVVLTNLATPTGGDDIGRHLLDPSYPLAKITAPKARVAITVDPKSLGKYVGAYQLSPRVVMTITQEGDQLFGQLTGQERFPLYPEAEGKFFLKVVDAQVTFPAGSDDNAPSATLHQNGRDQVAKRIDEGQATGSTR